MILCTYQCYTNTESVNSSLFPMMKITIKITLKEEIYFLSFERSGLEGKYSLIISVYACMHCVWGDVDAAVAMGYMYFCCMHGQFGSVLFGI
jgi:hypothetical protein